MPDLKNRVSPRISLYADTSLESLQRYEKSERLDLVVRYSSSGRFPGLVSKKLFDINMVPIISCSADKPSSMKELLAQPRIKVIGPFDGWSQWDRHFKQKPTGPVVLETDSYHAAVLAMERGEGMCVAILPYIQPWISNGRVSSMSQFEFDVDQSAHLVFAHHNLDNPAIANFHSWLCESLSC
jgi:DNA-binding transcriptional LysR family regulator